MRKLKLLGLVGLMMIFSACNNSSLFVGAEIKGYLNTTPENTMFSDITGMDIDDEGNLYVLDNGNGLIRKVTPDGTVITFAGGGKNKVYEGEYKKNEIYLSDSLTDIKIDDKDVYFCYSGGIFKIDKNENVIFISKNLDSNIEIITLNSKNIVANLYWSIDKNNYKEVKKFDPLVSGVTYLKYFAYNKLTDEYFFTYLEEGIPYVTQSKQKLIHIKSDKTFTITNDWECLNSIAFDKEGNSYFLGCNRITKISKENKLIKSYNLSKFLFLPLSLKSLRIGVSDAKYLCIDSKRKIFYYYDNNAIYKVNID